MGVRNIDEVIQAAQDVVNSITNLFKVPESIQTSNRRLRTELEIYSQSALTLSEALANCLSKAERGEYYAARPCSLRGVIYYWERKVSGGWKLHTVDSLAEEYSDEVLLEGWEVVSGGNIFLQWPKPSRVCCPFRA